MPSWRAFFANIQRGGIFHGIYWPEGSDFADESTTGLPALRAGPRTRITPDDAGSCFSVLGSLPYARISLESRCVALTFSWFDVFRAKQPYAGNDHTEIDDQNDNQQD